jgi:polysaccharide export outer membrane protein
MKTMRMVGGLVAAVLLATGCAHTQPAQVVTKDEPYRIGSSDVLQVAVWKDPDLSREMPVRPDGFISLPIAGEVKANGMTATELEQVISKKLATYVQDPRVTVIVKEVNSSRVFVTGEVAHPGAYPIPGRTSLVQAIALAGGFTEFADSDGIVVIHKQGSPNRVRVRYSDLISTDDHPATFTLQPGDTIVVP